jgi:hypothetical protein
VPGAAGLGVPADHREGAPEPLGLTRRVLVEMTVETAPDDLGDRDAESTRLAPDPAMLAGIELNLDPDHDGIAIPS